MQLITYALALVAFATYQTSASKADINEFNTRCLALGGVKGKLQALLGGTGTQVVQQQPQPIYYEYVQYPQQQQQYEYVWVEDNQQFPVNQQFETIQQFPINQQFGTQVQYYPIGTEFIQGSEPFYFINRQAKSGQPEKMRISKADYQEYERRNAELANNRNVARQQVEQKEPIAAPPGKRLVKVQVVKR